MIKVNCAHCGKYLFTSDSDSIGAAASEARQKGCISKLPIFFGVTEFKIFCNKECKDAWFGELSEEARKEGNEKVRKFRNEVQKDIPELQKGLAKIQEVFNDIKKRIKR